MGRPHDLKGTLARLASPAGDWITGHNLIVGSAWSIWVPPPIHDAGS